MEPIELAAIFSSITGVTFLKLLKLIKTDNGNLGVGLFRLLAAIDPHDDLVGHWQLAEWNYRKGPTDHLKHAGWKVVDGSLSLFFVYPNEYRWRGLMVLHYRKKGIDSGIKRIVPDCFYKMIGDIFIGRYEIVLSKDNTGLSGTSTMLWRNPPKNKKFTGTFDELKIDNIGRLVGKFRNTETSTEGIVSVADPVIFQPKTRWGELASIHFCA